MVECTAGCEIRDLACHDGAEVSASGLKIGRSPVQISPKTNFSIMIKLPVKSTGKKNRIRFDLKTVDYLRGIKYLYYTFSPRFNSGVLYKQAHKNLRCYIRRTGRIWKNQGHLYSCTMETFWITPEMIPESPRNDSKTTQDDSKITR